MHLPLSSFDGQVFIFLFFSLSGEKWKMPEATVHVFQVIKKPIREGMKLWVMFFTDIREGGHGLPYSSSSKNSSYGGRRTKYKDIRIGTKKKKKKDQISFKTLDVCDLRWLLTITCYCSSLL